MAQPDRQPGILWLVLDQSSHAALLERCPARFVTVFAHHVTLRYGIHADDPLVTALTGNEVTIEAYAEAYNSDTQAMRVHATDLPDTYGVPHVTVSTREGIAPYTSVAMLQGDHAETRLQPTLALTGTILFELLSAIRD